VIGEERRARALFVIDFEASLPAVKI